VLLRPSVRCLGAVVLMSLVSLTAAADPTLPPWAGTELPSWSQSVRILKGDEALLFAPERGAKRRGSASREANLPLFGARTGHGCGGLWLHVGPQAWVCEDAVELSGAPPLGAGQWAFRPGADGLPFRYFFVGPDGSLAYERIEEVDVGEPAMSLEPGFAVAIVEQRLLGAEPIGRTNRGLWIPMRDLGPARPLAFHGSATGELHEGRIPFAWVVAERAPLYRRHGGLFAGSGESRVRFQRVGYLEEAGQGFGRHVRIDDESWLRARDIRHPTLAPPPSEPGIAAGERWIDIELASQTLVAYEGLRPIFATLISTGRGRQGSELATPKGVFRIWIKLVTSVMDNLENDEASRYYRIEDVPYVQYFSKGVGLHAAFWHRSFGRVRSHGCVNLAPLDALRLFQWTSPRLPAGWTAVLPTGFDRGTIVRVR